MVRTFCNPETLSQLSVPRSGVPYSSFATPYTTEALQLIIQAFNLNIPYQFLVILPYLIVLLALIGLTGKSHPPAALGKNYKL